ncbi:uncharacterized protein LOC144061251 [Vanacampus margaritifer]
MSPSLREEDSPERVLHLEESASLSDVTNSVNGVNNPLADKQDDYRETAASSSPLTPYSSVALESHKRSSSNPYCKVNSVIEEDFYKAGNVPKCEMGKTSLQVAPSVEAVAGSASPGDAVRAKDEDEYGARSRKELEEYIAKTQRDEDNSDAPTRNDQMRTDTPATDKGEDVDAQIKIDEASSYTLTGNIQEKSHIQSRDEENAYDAIGDVEGEFDNSTRRDEEWYDAPPIKDGENCFSPNREDEEYTCAPPGDDEEESNVSSGKVEWSNARTVGDEDWSDALTGNVQEESYIPIRDEENVYAPFGKVEVKSDNLTRRDQECYDAPPVKDEDNYFSPNGQDIEYSSGPTGDDEKCFCAPPIKQDTVAPTVKTEENIDAQTKKYEECSINLYEKHETGSAVSLIKHDSGIDSLAGNIEEEYSTLPRSDGEGSDAPLTKDEGWSSDPAGMVEENSDIPTRRDSDSDSPLVKDDERADGFSQKVKLELINLFGKDVQSLNKIETGHQEGKADDLQPFVLTGNNEVIDKYDAPTGKEVDKSNVKTGRNEELSNSTTQKDEAKFRIPTIRIEKVFSTLQEKDEQGSDASLMTDEFGSNDPTNKTFTNNSHDPSGKDNFFDPIRKNEDKSDSPSTRDEDESHVSLVNACGSSSPPIKDEEWSVASSQKEEEGSHSLLIKDEERCSDPTGKSYPQTRRDEEDCYGPSIDEIDEIEAFDAQPVNYENESASIIKDEDRPNDTTVKVRVPVSVCPTRKGKEDSHTQTGKRDCNASTENIKEKLYTPIRRVEDNCDEKLSEVSLMKDEEESDNSTGNIDTQIIRDKDNVDAPSEKYEDNNVAPTRKYEKGSADPTVKVEGEEESSSRRDKNDSGARSGKLKDNSVAPTQIDEEKSEAQPISCPDGPKGPPVKDEAWSQATTRKDEGSHTLTGNIFEESYTPNKRQKDSDVPLSEGEEDSVALTRTHDDCNENGSDNPHGKDQENNFTVTGKDQEYSNIIPVKCDKGSGASLEAEHHDPTKRVQECDTQTANNELWYNEDYDAQSSKDEEESFAPSGIYEEGCDVPPFKDEAGSIEQEFRTLTRSNEQDSEKVEGSDTPPGKDKEDTFIPTRDEKEDSDASLIKDIVEHPLTTENVQECDIPTEGHKKWSHTPTRQEDSDAQNINDEKGSDVPTRVDQKKSGVSLLMIKESVMPAGSIEKESSTAINEQDSENADCSDTPHGNGHGNGQGNNYSTPTGEDEVVSVVIPIKYENRSDSSYLKNEAVSRDTAEKLQESDTSTLRNDDLAHATSRKEFDAQTQKDGEESDAPIGINEKRSDVSFLKDEEGSDMPTRHIEEESSSPARRNKQGSAKDEGFYTLTGNTEDVFHIPTKRNEEDSHTPPGKDEEGSGQGFDDSPMKDDEGSNELTGKVEEVSNALSGKDDKTSDAPPEIFEQECDPALINYSTRGDAKDSDVLPSKDEASSEAEAVDEENSPTTKDEHNSESPTGIASEESNAPTIHLQLLQVLQNVSSGQNLSMLQELMESLARGSHTLECIKEESSEDELLAELSPELSADNVEIKTPLFSTQDYLECVGRLQDHADVLEDVRRDLLTGEPTGTNMEELQMQIDEIQSLESQVSLLAGVLTEDMEKAKLLLNASDENIPTQICQDLSSTYVDLEYNFTAVCQECAERTQALFRAMEIRKAHLESTYQKHLTDLDVLAHLIQKEIHMADVDFSTCDVKGLKSCIQKNKDAENHLHQEAKLKLEDITFAIQSFISEHAHLLSPAQSSCLLKCLSSTQRAFRDQTDKLVTMRCTLDVLLDTKEREDQKKVCL